MWHLRWGQEREFAIVGNPRMSHKFRQAHPGDWILVQQGCKQVLQRVADKYVPWKSQRSFAYLLVQAQDGVGLEGNKPCTSQGFESLPGLPKSTMLG